MIIHPIHTGNFKLDGGAMFGVVPKSLWQRTNPADERNMCSWSLRCMLIETNNRLILIDTGIGNKQSEKFYSYYFLFGSTSLDSELKRLGYERDDITDVFLTHLHFDHCGGAIERRSSDGMLVPAFKNAKFYSNKNHWKWATEPNPREKASFLKENIQPIQESGQLEMIGRSGNDRTPWIEGIELFFADGHTESQMIPILNYKGQKLAFMADLLPSTGHIPLPYLMGYDTRPLLTLDEKSRFLSWAADEDVVLFLEHDFESECCTVQHTEKGVRLKNKGALSDFF
jgi:glyoxylase-like metal-dependent hydrolase (beta-lactamase superfamily II)